ncbi:MAG: hypothetical protein DHS20C09_00430 [marine bacterium B5-7]|nr:MAG: hypothetical protein DHS20C09_00430 [marine bacterium B5-7]
MNTKNKLSALIISLMLIFSFSAAKAEVTSLEEAYETIALLTTENESLKAQLSYFEKEIAAYREKLEAYDDEESSEESEE